MKTADTIHSDIISRFENRVNDKIQTGSNIDFYTDAVSYPLADIYQEIENNKNPHIWTGLTGTDLDKTGVSVNCPRNVGESDANYLYRLMNWVLRNEASNSTAISDALLSPTYASNINYVPYIKGAGTAACYIIPKKYEADTITNAINEAKSKIEKVASPSLHVEYIIPEVKAVRLIAIMKTNDGDEEKIKQNIEYNICKYINAIAPKDYLHVGLLNKIGIAQSNVDYFSIASVIIDNDTVDEIDILQGIDTKMLYDDMTWIEG